MELHGRDYTSLSSDISQITDEIEELLNVLQWVSRKPEKSRYQSPEESFHKKTQHKNEMYGDYVLYLVWTHFSAFWHRFNLGYFLFFLHTSAYSPHHLHNTENILFHCAMTG